MHARFLLSLGSGILALSMLAGPMQAHHGWAGNTEDIRLSGTVERSVSLAGPHATMRIRDAEGQVWEITLAPPARTQRAGLQEDTIPAGSEVTISGQRNRDPNRLEIKTEQVAWNGRTFDIYPNRP